MLDSGVDYNCKTSIGVSIHLCQLTANFMASMSRRGAHFSKVLMFRIMDLSGVRNNEMQIEIEDELSQQGKTWLSFIWSR